uniref:Superoxide dismutase copper/zinc binding domain-containing protein n=1 Tax=Astyanax mexicanus TaxID=7994 RepID=A0A3B1JIL5_ASTMX
MYFLYNFGKNVKKKKKTFRIVSALIDMRGIKGEIIFHQSSPFDLTTLTVNLTNLNGRVGPYHVHLFPTPTQRSPPESTCSNDNLGGHWNPFGVNTQVGVYPPPYGSTHDLYEVGDLSSRHGSLANAVDFQASFTDWNLPLFGQNSIVGRLSMQIYLFFKPLKTSKQVLKTLKSAQIVRQTLFIHTVP